MSSAEIWVPLKGGPPVPLSVIRWLIDAGERGIDLNVGPDGDLRLGPRSRVSGEDLAFVRAHLRLLVKCAQYIARDARKPH
jgi:hypothetical protein